MKVLAQKIPFPVTFLFRRRFGVCVCERLVALTLRKDPYTGNKCKFHNTDTRNFHSRAASYDRIRNCFVQTLFNDILRH